MKIWLYGLLSVLLLFTAAIVSNIEAVQQTLNVTLDTTQAAQPQTPALVITPELLDTLCGLLQTTSVQEEQATPLLLTQGQAREEEGENNGERVQAYLAEHPKATLREIAEVLTLPLKYCNVLTRNGSECQVESKNSFFSFKREFQAVCSHSPRILQGKEASHNPSSLI